MVSKNILENYKRKNTHDFRLVSVNPFITVISEDPWHSHLFIAERLQWSCHCTCLITNRFYCGWDSNTQPSACETNALIHCATTAASFDLEVQQLSFGFV